MSSDSYEEQCRKIKNHMTFWKAYVQNRKGNLFCYKCREEIGTYEISDQIRAVECKCEILEIFKAFKKPA